MRILFYSILLSLLVACDSRLEVAAETSELALLKQQQAILEEDIAEVAALRQLFFDSTAALRIEEAKLKTEISILRKHRDMLDEPLCHSCPLPAVRSTGKEIY